MPLDAQSLCNIIATEGYDKLSKRALLEAILAAVATGGGGGACAAQSGAGSPVGSVIPAFIDQLYHDTVADAYWRSTGLTVADWTAIGGGLSSGTIMASSLDNLDLNSGNTDTILSFPNLISISNSGLGKGFIVSGSSQLTTLDCPNLVSIAGVFDASNCATLTTINANLLQNVGADLNIGNDLMLASLNLSSLTGVNGSIAAAGCSSLISISMPNFFACGMSIDFSSCSLLSNLNLPIISFVDGTGINFNGDALTVVSVELLLRRLVLAGVTTCTIDLSGGTNAGLASLSAQGQADYAALVTAGNTMSINP